MQRHAPAGNASARDQLEAVASSNRQRFSLSIDRLVYADTLMALFNSLMSLKMSLFFKINSLFRILGNFGKKHRRLLRFLTSQTPNLARNRTTSLYFPCRSGNSPQRLVRCRLHHPPTSLRKERFLTELANCPAIPRIFLD